MTGVTRRGPVGAPAIIFLHGGVINRHMWERVIGALDTDYDCVAIDLPGHGDARSRPFRMKSAIETVDAVVRSLELGGVFVVGLSLGGYVAQAYTAAHAEAVRGLLLSGSTIRYTGWDGLSTKLYGMLFPVLARPARKAFAAKMRSDLSDTHADAIIGGGLSMKGGAQSMRRLPGTDYAAEMVGFRGPIVMANGERDTPNRDAEALFMEHHPHAVSMVIEDAGHACALQQPEAFAAAVRQMVHLASRRA